MKYECDLSLREMEMPTQPVRFLENGLHFQANVVEGQKTGFFFDQRDNRARVRQLAKDRSVLNLFAYTGGFSIYAGCGGASHVTSVDLAKPAMEEAQRNWQLNGLPDAKHHVSASDAFEFLEKAKTAKRSWDLVVVDPPSFAPAERHVKAALASYQALFTAALHVLVAAFFSRMTGLNVTFDSRGAKSCAARKSRSAG